MPGPIGAAVAIMCKIIVSDADPEALIAFRGELRNSNINLKGCPMYTVTFEGDCESIEFVDERKTCPTQEDIENGMKKFGVKIDDTTAK